VAGGRGDAVAAVDGLRQRGPGGPVAGHGDAVDEELARAHEVAADAAGERGRGLVASRAGTQVAGLVVVADEDHRIVAEVVAGPGLRRSLELTLGGPVADGPKPGVRRQRDRRHGPSVL